MVNARRISPKGIIPLVAGISLALYGCGSSRAAMDNSPETRVRSIGADLLLEAQQALKRPKGETVNTCRLVSESGDQFSPQDISAFLQMQPEDIHGVSWSKDGAWMIYLESEARTTALSLTIKTVRGQCRTFDFGKFIWRETG
jgi:hypothetical protein